MASSFARTSDVELTESDTREVAEEKAEEDTQGSDLQDGARATDGAVLPALEHAYRSQGSLFVGPGEQRPVVAKAPPKIERSVARCTLDMNMKFLSCLVTAIGVPWIQHHTLHGGRVAMDASARSTWFLENQVRLSIARGNHVDHGS